MLHRQALIDWGIPVLLAVLCTLEVLSVRPDGMVAALMLGLGSCLALVGRRRWPMLSGLVAGVLTLAAPWFGPELDDLAAPIFVIVVAAFSVARWLPDYRGVVVLVAILLLLTGDYLFTDERDNNITDVFFVSAFLLPPYAFGRVARKLALQSEQLASQQELVKREAVRAERERIARELHDVIAHSVSAMVVQTSAAQDLLTSDPKRAATVLADVAATGRQALSETGQLLHVLRDPNDELGLSPTPGLAQIHELVERFRRDGLDVHATIPDDLPSLATAVDVSSYRIVQEALNNALRYAPDRRVELVVEAGRDNVAIRVVNRSGTQASSQGSGLGLLGLAERVSLLGGRLTHGLSGGRFELAAELPVGPAS